MEDTCKDILFIREVLMFMVVPIKLTIVVRVDNMVALFMETNGCGKRSKHVDSRHHFIQHYDEKGIIKIIFIPTDENTAYEFTKNNSGEKY